MWLLEHVLAGMVPATATPTNLNRCMVMLRSAAKRATALEEANTHVRNMPLRCNNARKRMFDLQRQRESDCEAEYTLPLLGACLQPGQWRDPHLRVPASSVPERPDASMHACRKRAAANIEHVQLLDVNETSHAPNGVQVLLQWLQQSRQTLVSAHTLQQQAQRQVLMRTVEAVLLRELLSRGGFAALDTKIDQIQHLQELAREYMAVHDEFIEVAQQDGKKFDRNRQYYGRALLVEMIAFCMVHRACVIHEPILGEYGVGIDWRETEALLLDDKEATDAALMVSEYLKEHSEAAKNTAVFSLSEQGQQDTFEFAHDVCTRSQTYAVEFQKRLNVETSAAKEREDAYWEVVEAKKANIARLRGGIRALERRVLQLESYIEQHTADIRSAQTEIKKTKEARAKEAKNRKRLRSILYKRRNALSKLKKDKSEAQDMLTTTKAKVAQAKERLEALERTVCVRTPGQSSQVMGEEGGGNMSAGDAQTAELNEEQSVTVSEAKEGFVNASDAKAAELNKELVSLKETHKECEADLIRLAANISSHENIIDDFQAQLSHTQESIETMDEAVLQKEKEIPEHESSVRNCERELAKARVQITQKKQRLAEEEQAPPNRAKTIGEYGVVGDCSPISTPTRAWHKSSISC